ncbi:MAG: SMI1/KNR4 family protein, partial [Actinobacteria bacterium]|nr:SMI1/KNR4 family protein [Actinomycetota bacterium]
IQNRLGIRLPEDYLEVVRAHQGAAPSRDRIALPDGTTTSLSMLLHFEPEPAQFNLVSIVENADTAYGKLVPFAVDPDGNYFCFDYRGETGNSSSETRWNRPVVLVAADDPTAEPTPIADGFTPLINSLQEEASLREGAAPGPDA